MRAEVDYSYEQPIVVIEVPKRREIIATSSGKMLRRIIRSYSGESYLLELDDQELLNALRLTITSEGQRVPTLAGLVLLGKADRIAQLVPTAESGIQVLDGTAVQLNESGVYPLLSVLEQAEGILRTWNRFVELEDGLFQIKIPNIAPRAFREAIVNAYCHRDYTKLGRVRISFEDAGVIISNPGGFIEGITLSNLLEAEPHGRNPVLADALKRIGLAEQSGRGIDRIFEGFLQYGSTLPDYSQSTNTLVRVVLPRIVPDKAFVSMVVQEQSKQGRSLSVKALLVLNALRNIQRATVEEISNIANLPDVFTKVQLEQLLSLGLVETRGSGIHKEYMLDAKVYRSTGEAIQYVRYADIDETRYEELVVTLTKQQSKITRTDVAELLHISKSQAYRIISKLKDSGQLEKVGSSKYTYYQLAE